MREIKFRAWHRQAKQMYEVASLDFTDFVGLKIDESEETVHVSLCHLNDVDLMQFTGLLDRDGKEVYEGDIVKANIEATEESHYGDDFGRGYWIGEVIYQNAGFYIRQANDKYMPTLANYCIVSLGVIGNIYENPDLVGEVTM